MPVRTTKREGAVVEGAVTRTVTDAAALLDAISEPAPFGWWNPPAPVRPFAAGSASTRPAADRGAEAGAVRL